MTNDEQYVPSEDLVIEAWKRYSGAQDAKYARLSDGDAGDEARRFLARVRRDAEAELDSWMARAYEAEKRAWRAETRLAGWMEHWDATARTGAVDEVAAILEANARADQAEADRDWNLRSSRLAKEGRIKANARADQAEARIKAVQDVLDRWQVDGYDALLRRIHRALDGTVTPPDAG